jgi:hypothetical protein
LENERNDTGMDRRESWKRRCERQMRGRETYREMLKRRWERRWERRIRRDMAFYRDLVCWRVRSVRRTNGGMETTPKVLRHASLAGVAVADYAAEQGHWVDIERSEHCGPVEI